MPPPHQVGGAKDSWAAEIKKQKTLAAKIKVALFHPGFLSNRLFVATAIVLSISMGITAWVVITNEQIMKNDRMASEVLFEGNQLLSESKKTDITPGIYAIRKDGEQVVFKRVADTTGFSFDPKNPNPEFLVFPNFYRVLRVLRVTKYDITGYTTVAYRGGSLSEIGPYSFMIAKTINP